MYLKENRNYFCMKCAVLVSFCKQMTAESLDFRSVLTCRLVDCWELICFFVSFSLNKTLSANAGRVKTSADCLSFYFDSWASQQSVKAVKPIGSVKFEKQEILHSKCKIQENGLILSQILNRYEKNMWSGSRG